MKRIFLSLAATLLCVLSPLFVQANIGSSPVVNTQGEVLYVKDSSTGSELLKVNTTDPSTVLASSNINARIFSSPVLDVDGFLYVATLQNPDGQSTYADKLIRHPSQSEFKNLICVNFCFAFIY